MAHLPSIMPTLRGKGRKGVFALREMCGASMRLMRMSHRRVHWAPAWGRRAHWAPAGGYSVPYSGKPTEPVPYPGKPTEWPMSSIQEARLRTTNFSHAFRPRFPATPKPRLSATSFSHAFRPCLPTCHSGRGRCVTPKRPKTFRSR